MYGSVNDPKAPVSPTRSTGGGVAPVISPTREPHCRRWGALYGNLTEPLLTGAALSGDAPSLEIAKQSGRKLLPQFIVRDKKIVLAQLGETGAELFPVYETGIFNFKVKGCVDAGLTAGPLSGFGIGLVMMFWQKLSLCACLLVCFFISSPTMMYFAGNEYSQGQKQVPFLLRGSAVCTYVENVTVARGANQTAHQLCTPHELAVYFDLAMCAFLGFFIFIICGRVHDKLETVADEDVQTPSDYSICVSDPGRNDSDIDKWFEFFSEYGAVKFVTIARGNGKLLKLLQHRRMCLQMLAETDGLDTTHHDAQGTLFRILGLKKGDEGRFLQTLRTCVTFQYFLLGVIYWRHEKEKVERALHEFMALRPHFGVKKVFVTFESEVGQRNCLKSLTVGLIDAFLDRGNTRRFEGECAAVCVSRADRCATTRECIGCARSKGTQ
jgi:hypothetical protein